jgi:hypothetical protein
MSTILAVVIFLIIVILITLLTIFWPRPKCFFDIDKLYAGIDIKLDPGTKEEIKNAIDYMCEKEQLLLTPCDTQNMSLFFIFFDGEINPLLQNLQLQNTYDFISNVHKKIEVKAAAICLIKKGGKTKQTNGYSEISNNYLRIVIPIQVTPKDLKLWCDGEPKFLKKDTPLCYDNSRQSFYHNENIYEDAIILIMDIARPKDMPIGISDCNKKCILC